MILRRGASGPLQAYVLHQYDWSESSLILDLCTRERGRLAVAAKGAKRPYSQLRGVLLPFQRLYVSLGRGADEQGAEVQTLRAAEWAGGMPMPSGGPWNNRPITGHVPRLSLSQGNTCSPR